MPAPLPINFGPPSSMPQSIPGAPPPSTTGLTAPPGPTLPDLGSLSGPPSAPVGPPPGAPPMPGQGGPMPVMSPVDGTPQFPPVQQTPADMQYDAITQMDGSVLIRLKNPDGSPGPIVEIIRAPKGKGAPPEKK